MCSYTNKSGEGDTEDANRDETYKRLKHARLVNTT